MRGVYLFIGIAHCVCIWCKTHNVFQIEKYYNKFILTSFCIHNNTKSYFNIASLYSVPADWEAIFAEISIVKHVELIDTAAPAKTRQCCVLSLWRNMRSLFENYLLRLGNTWTSSWGWKDTKMFQWPNYHSNPAPCLQESRVADREMVFLARENNATHNKHM